MKLTITIDCELSGPIETARLLAGLTAEILGVAMLTGQPAPLCIAHKGDV